MNKNLLILGVLLLLVLGSLLFIFKDRIPILNNDYTLPNNLTYSQDPGWSDVSGDGWTISFKKDWKLSPVLDIQGSKSYSNKEQGDDLILIIVSLPAGGFKSTIKEELDVWKIVIETPQSSRQLIKSQELTINGYESGIIISKVKDRNTIWLTVYVDKNEIVYTLDISVTENFYKSNKADIEYLISSFR